MGRRRTALLEEDDLQVEAYVELMRAHEALSGRFRVVFKDLGVTGQQYNVLRILYVRDPGRGGLSCQQIGERLIQRLPDITRLLDRLEGAGWVERERSEEDRRVVLTRLTDPGHDLVEVIHPRLMEVHAEVLGHMKESELKTLRRLLQKARTPS
jgi:DNA-binding MarR family transcriptional regulator